MSYGKQVDSAHFENACGVLPYPTASAGAWLSCKITVRKMGAGQIYNRGGPESVPVALSLIRSTLVLVVSTAQMFFEPEIEADEEIAATHLLYL